VQQASAAIKAAQQQADLSQRPIATAPTKTD